MSGKISEVFLAREKLAFSKYAFFTADTKGRQFPYIPCQNRTEFQRDRDRILHSKSFRRLMHKTQVFLLPAGEHYRTRMTHTLEVSQIARIIARALRLNEDLCEAIALGHDLGHTPFGHAGEVVMQKYLPDFMHYKQSLRVVESLENDGEGLNLTYEVRDGILNHTGDLQAETLEGVVVKFADRIAYINHDIDDACRAGIITVNDIPKKLREILGQGHSERINRMVTSIINASTDSPQINMEDEVFEATIELRQFLFKNVYTNPLAKSEESKAQQLLMHLFEYFLQNPAEMPKLYYNNIEENGEVRCVCDFLSSMTDRYAIELYRKLFIPEVWRDRRL